ncbi:MAG: hypothetical protein M3Y36_11610, partial [Actinomycetota bacterium]|nr:hypothetical protein [Actinomycetota bacterium]
MFCPRCGITQAENQERCGRCAGLLARPERRPLPPLREVASPTRRGELAQRASGVVVPPRPRRRPDPAPAVPPALGGPVASPRPPTPYPAPVTPAVTAAQAGAPEYGPPTGAPTAAYP